VRGPLGGAVLKRVVTVLGAAAILTLALDSAAQPARDSDAPTATMPPPPAASSDDEFDPGPRTAKPPTRGSARPAPPPPGAQAPPPAAPSAQHPPPGTRPPAPGYGYPPPGYGYPPAGYGYPAPGYGYPVPAYVVVPRDPRPDELEYREGRSPPPGYYEDTKIRKGFVIPGAIVFGVSYGLGYFIATAGSEGDVILLMPVAGPILWGHTKECDEYGGHCGSPTLGWFLGIGQAVGITLFCLGVAKKEKVWRREEIGRGSITLSPMLVGGRSPGLGLIGRL
jgi:hypothetical protein